VKGRIELDVSAARRLAVLAVLSVSLNGCTKTNSGEKPADTAAPPAQPAQATSGPVALKGFPGQNAGATLAYLASLTFSTPTNDDDYIHGDVDCDGNDNAGCTQHGSGKPTTRKMLGIAEAHSHEVNWSDVLQPNYGDSGYIVAKLTNMGKKRSNHWQLNAGDSGYLWVGPDPGATAPNQKIVEFVVIDAQGHLSGKVVAKAAKICDDDITQGPKRPNTHIFPVLGGHCGLTEGGANHMKVIWPKNIEGLVVPENSGFWVSCSGGCCEAADLT
jgi:hypothetical protein